MTAIAPFPADEQDVIIRPMLTIDDAIDLYLGDLARRGREDRTRDSYRRTLYKLADSFPRNWDVSNVTADDCERFLDRWAHRTRGTQAQIHAPLSGLFRFLYRTRRIKHNPMEFVPTVARQRPEDLDVVTVDPADVPRLLAEAETWTERLTVSVLAYIGPRRRATATLRLRDYNQRTGELRFREKGSKTIWKPVPDELRALLEAALAAGVYTGPADYLIPPEGPLVRKGDRDDRVIWRVVKKIAARCSPPIETHVHALRGAFACFYLQSNPGDLYGLQQLLGHESLETTRVYLRRFNKKLAMEPVRSLSWLGNTAASGFPQSAGSQFEASRAVGAGGFEPPSDESGGAEQADSVRSADDLGEALRSRLPRPQTERAR